MERIIVIGASCRHLGAEELARLTVAKEERAARLPALAEGLGARELVYLATCNRVEVALLGEGPHHAEEYRRRTFRLLAGREPAPGEAERTFRAWVGEGAVEHLFLVAAGLDSARVGEREIRVQVREALKTARRAGWSGTMLDFVFTEALRVAAEVLREVPRDGDRESLADLALDHLRDRLHRTPGRVALVGVSPMTRHCGLALAGEAPLVVVNRTLSTAESLARELGGEARSLDEFRARPDGVEAVLVATGSADVLLGRAELERLAARAPSGEPPLVVDLSVPADTDREAARDVGAEVVDMDTLLAEASADRHRRLLDFAPARELVDRRLAELRRGMAERLMAPVIARLHDRYRETAAEGVERLFGKELSGLGEEEREAVRRWAEVLARRFAHVPTKGLRELAAEFGAPAVEAFLAASGEDLFPGRPDELLERLDTLVESEG